ncbi:DGQHR domain-containing protein [Dyadobacter chenhuakuii]|uniref:DGQHR domain-containing protein n=1 Tax=Dyadobacter chenhuakuii TaxID=2909339 RepID=A0A9X1QAT8_9BACT|nr:DGQHR domain-containing protein [Dyadobacter chenhuakuii]MCF2497639.1 DGQHR domain-containing protein [Dyadobacter chenhuakuii]
MNKTQRDQFLDSLVSDSEMQKVLRLRKLDSYKESFNNGSALLEERLGQGWEIDVVLKTKTKIFKTKDLKTQFEDKVWVLFAQLGFNTVSKDQSIEIPYDKRDTSLRHPITFFAKDDETVILVDCISAPENTQLDLKDYLDLLRTHKSGIINYVSTLYPGTRPKIKYILATKNIGITSEHVTALKNLSAIQFTEEIIDYYYTLYNQIGSASRYQLLGTLFEGQEIPELDNLIPAIEGKMGGHTYYSFSIEPEKLLKISYILHRNKAHENMMPTYQRLIKKSRLREIHKFIDEEKGYFPNSIIINIVTEKKKILQFDRSNNQQSESISKIGILHLPKKYKSAYVIDGQHRLYGYSNSQYKSTNTIPVVALVNLERSEQIKLFMQINENQKAVSKDLRNTLDADLLWDSDSYLDQLKALKSRLAISLGEDRLSPLYDKISIGEDKKLITTQQIGTALNKSDFLGKVKAKEIEKNGTFFSGNLQQAFDNLLEYLSSCFTHIKNGAGDIWDQEGNIILINKGFYAIILTLNDVVNHLYKENLATDYTSAKKLYQLSSQYLDSIIDFYKSIDEEKISELKTAYGTSGEAKYWRTLQASLKNQHPDVHYEGLEDYIKKEEKENNELAFKLIREIESRYLKKAIKDKLEEEFGKNWFKKGVPLKIYTDANALAVAKNREIEDDEQLTDPWDQLTLINYREVILNNWQKLFETMYTRPSEKKISGGKEAKTKWLSDLNRLRNANYHTYYVTSEELSFIEEIHDWLAEGKSID